MKLTDLDATFLGEVKPDGSCRHLPGVEGAQGVMFQCPKCATGLEVCEEDGRRFVRGAHYVICWFANPRNAPKVPDSLDPKPGRWHFTGDTLETLTFTGPGSYSVLLTSGCQWHGFLDNGDAK